MDKPMVYLEEGGWGYTCVDACEAIWLEPGWYEAFPESKEMGREVEMIVFKEDTEPTDTGLRREYGPTFDSFREMTTALLGHDPDTTSVSLQSEGPSAACSDRETRYYPPLQPGTLTPGPHPLHQVPPHDSLASWCDGLADTHTDESDDSSLPT